LRGSFHRRGDASLARQSGSGCFAEVRRAPWRVAYGSLDRRTVRWLTLPRNRWLRLPEIRGAARGFAHDGLHLFTFTRALPLLMLRREFGLSDFGNVVRFHDRHTLLTFDVVLTLRHCLAPFPVASNGDAWPELAEEGYGCCSTPRNFSDLVEWYRPRR
jgi:hypothetical protein